MTRRNRRRRTTAFRQALVCLLERFVNKDKSVDYKSAIGRRLRQRFVDDRREVGRMPLQHVNPNEINLAWKATSYQGIFKIKFLRKFEAHLKEGMRRPVAEPVQHASVKQRRRRSRAIFQTFRRWVHRKNDVQISYHLYTCENSTCLLGERDLGF